MTDGVLTIRFSAGGPVEATGAAPGSVAEPVTPAGRLRLPVAHGSGATSEFLAGPENRLAVAAVESLLAERHSPFNPLVLHGPSGTGKSHLAVALSRCWATERRLAGSTAAGQAGSGTLVVGDGEVVYATAADFARWLKTAIDERTTAALRTRLRGAALLVIEDLTQLAERRAAQQELLATLDAVLNGGGQVIVTSRTAPERIAGLSPELASRLTGGLTVPLAPPDRAARLAFVERLAKQRGFELSAAAARALADGITGTMADLRGAVVELHALAERDGHTIDVAAVRRWLAERRSRLRPSLRTITRAAAKHYGLRVADLASPSRQRNVVQARAVAIYLARELTESSLEQLGRHFGGRDHTTVLHSFRAIEGRMRTDPATRRAVADIRKVLAPA